MTKSIKSSDLHNAANLFYTFFQKYPDLLIDLSSDILINDKGISIEELSFNIGYRSIFENIIKLTNMIGQLDLSSVVTAVPNPRDSRSIDYLPSYTAFGSSEGKEILYHLMDNIMHCDYVSQDEKVRYFYLYGMRTFLANILMKANISYLDFIMDYNFMRNRAQDIK